jgi:hypothetical protein
MTKKQKRKLLEDILIAADKVVSGEPNELAEHLATLYQRVPRDSRFCFFENGSRFFLGDPADDER